MPTSIEYLCNDWPEAGTVRKIAKGILWLRMPLPFQLDHINLWLIEDSDGWALVDTGINTPETVMLWRSLLKNLPNGGGLTRLICTHSHPDHMGLAGWFESEFYLEMATTENEWRNGEFFSRDRENGDNKFSDYFRKAGCNEFQVKQVSDHILGANHLYFAIPKTFNVITHGDDIEIGGRYWEVIVTSGHSVEHVCLYCEEDHILIAGDQVLPKITPTIVLHPYNQDANPLRDFLISNKLFRPLPEDTLVLPGHNLPFRGLHARLDDYEIHHETRLDSIYEACGAQRSAMGIASRVFNLGSNPHQLFFAIGETLSHIRYLENYGLLNSTADRDGVTLYKKVA